MTNRDKINEMSNIELAKILDKIGCDFCTFRDKSSCSAKCIEGVEQWLESEVNEND